jgi:hypothetical protein
MVPPNEFTSPFTDVEDDVKAEVSSGEFCTFWFSTGYSRPYNQYTKHRTANSNDRDIHTFTTNHPNELVVTGSSLSGASGLGVGLVGMSSSSDVLSEFGVVIVGMSSSRDVLSEFGVVIVEMFSSCDGVSDRVEYESQNDDRFSADHVSRVLFLC